MNRDREQERERERERERKLYQGLVTYTHTHRDIEDARAAAVSYVVKDLRMVLKALEARAVRTNDESQQDAFDFAIELVKSVIDSHA